MAVNPFIWRLNYCILVCYVATDSLGEGVVGKEWDCKIVTASDVYMLFIFSENVELGALASVINNKKLNGFQNRISLVV